MWRATGRLKAACLQLDDWETVTGADPLGAHHGGQLGRYLTGLRQLANESPDRTAAVLLAALALGPRTSDPPVMGDLCSLLATAAPTTVDVVDLCIAWGCGWGRVVRPGA